MEKNRVTFRQGLAALRIALLVAVMLLGSILVRTQDVQAAPACPVKITDCRVSSAGKLTVRATAESVKKIPGSKCYLMYASYSTMRPESGAKPLAVVKTAKSMVFKVNLKKYDTEDLLGRPYIILSRNRKGKYVIVSSCRYVTNPDVMASYKYAFPSGTSKKGLQIKGSMPEDSQELNVQNGLINIVLSDVIAGPGSQNSAASIPFQYNGKTYWFDRGAVSSYDSQLSALKANKAVMSAVLLMQYRSDLSDLIYPSARTGGASHAFYAWNYEDKSARETLSACLTFLAKRYSAKNGQYGRIVNWIVGNEVNAYDFYNYAGNISFSRYVQVYAGQFRLTYNAVRRVYSNARVYISLDHLWNTKVPGSYTARKMLEAFAKEISNGGYIQWNLAYHPYASPLTEPRFWSNWNKQVTNDFKTTPVINMLNLSLLTNYIRTNFGSSTRIILSEQGYTSVSSGKDTQKEQAAAIVYSYYLTEADNMVDSFIMNRHVDHQTEVEQGLNLGLWTTNGVENADQKKKAWKTFKYMDTSQSEKVAKSSLKVIGAKNWGELIGGFSAKLYSKTKVMIGKLTREKSYGTGTALKAGWTGYGAVSGISRDAASVTVSHLTGVNPNRLWGVSQYFKKRLNREKKPVLYATVCINGAYGSSAVVKLRIFSGKKVFECEQTIPCGQNVCLRASMAKWKYVKAISRIQITAMPKGGGWNSGAVLTVSNARFLKK